MTTVDVAVVGGGPAGALVAARLAAAGRSVHVLERSPIPRWRACGVFSSPASAIALRRFGIDDATIARVARPIPAMRVESADGTSFRLTYGDDGTLRAAALGYDRTALDEALLDHAASAGASVRRGTAVTAVDLGDPAGGVHLAIDGPDGRQELAARLVVGADGIRSLVARSAGVVRRPPLGSRIGLTFHVEDPRPDGRRDARMVVLRGAYCGLAPVPGGRINVGIVLASRAWRDELARRGAAGVADRVLGEVPRTADDVTAWAGQPRCDPIRGASPLGHRVSRRAGSGWLLIGDAAGFLDPFTGEGLHRALVSAELAAAAIDRTLAGSPTALGAYDRAMTRRFATKDLVTAVVQAFLGRAWLFEYAARRLAGRNGVRETMGLVMGDLAPARRALDPRFLVALLRP